MKIDVTEFLEDLKTKNFTSHSVITYKSNITKFLEFVGDPVNVDISTLQRFLIYLRDDFDYRVGKVHKKGVCPRTIQAYFSCINTYYDFLLFTHRITHNPVPEFTKRYLRIKTQHNGDNTRQLISIQQMSTLINQRMPIQDRAILMILAKTGVRRGELLSMDIGDIDLQKKEIILKPKHKRTNRLVLFDDETAHILGLFLKWRKLNARPNCDALFISATTGNRIHKDTPPKIVAKYGKRLGIHNPQGNLNQKFSPHCFRHWFTTHLRRAGMPREFIQELRGDRRRDAIDIYDHIDLSELHIAYERYIPKLMSQSQG